MLTTPLISIDFERSGVDEGKIVYTINVARVEGLGDADFQDLLESVDALRDSCTLAGRHRN